MTTRQLAPSPDYSTHDTVDWTVRHCGDCGDICMTMGETDRCDTCRAAHLDELATAKRVLQRVPLGEIFEAASAEVQTRSGGMNDPRTILCEGCGEVAVSFTGEPGSLTPGEMFGECTCWGRLSIESDDEGRTVARFIRLGCD